MTIQHVVSVSGGKDSTAVYLMAIESGRPFRAVFADTGNEHELTYEYIMRLHEHTGGPKVETVRADFTADLARHKAYLLRVWPGALRKGKPGHWNWSGDDDVAPEGDAPPVGDPWSGRPRPRIDAVNGYWTWAPGIKPLNDHDADVMVAEAAALHEPTGNPYLDLCISKGRFPSRMAQFCTGELKEIPINRQVVAPMLREGPVLQWPGIRADESLRRAKQPRFNHHESGSMIWRPIFRWSVEDVWAQHRKHALRPNPLYAMGMGRVGCMPCINCRKSELRTIAELFPEHVDRIHSWEALVAKASKRGAASFFAPINGDVLPIREVVEWSGTTHGGRQYGMFFDDQRGGGCTSDLGLCERAAA